MPVCMPGGAIKYLSARLIFFVLPLLLFSFTFSGAHAATSFSVVAPVPAKSGTGLPVSLIVNALDQMGNPDTGYRGTIHFTSTDAQAVLPADYTVTSVEGDGSVFRGAFILKTLGMQTITARDTVTASIAGSANLTNVAVPTLTGFVISPGVLNTSFNNPNGGTNASFPSATVTLTFSAPIDFRDGVPVTITMNDPGPGQAFSDRWDYQVWNQGPFNVVTVSAMTPYSNTFQFPIYVSNVLYPRTGTFTVTAGGVTIPATLTLNPGYLRVVGTDPDNVTLVWDNNNGAITKITRIDLTTSGVETTLPTGALTGSGSYVDASGYINGHTYEYQLYYGNSVGGRDRATLYKTLASSNQAVDSRIDPRYSTNHFLDHQFGASTYLGGLFVGKAADSAKVGRSFSLFNVPADTTQGAFRSGNAAAFVTSGAGNVSNLPVGCQFITQTNWDAASLVWTTQPTFLPSAAQQTLIISYGPGGRNPPWGWYQWPLNDQIRGLVSGGTAVTASMAWAATNETLPGWLYFCKREYDPTKAPALVHVWAGPSLLGMAGQSTISWHVTDPITGAVSPRGYGSLYLITNGLGPSDYIYVTVSGSSTPVRVTGWPTLISFPLGPQPAAGTTGGAGVTVTYGSDSVSGSVTVTP